MLKKGAAGTNKDHTIDWADLLTEHGAVLYRTAYRLLGRADEAEDCVQDVLVELLSRQEPFKVENWSAVLRWMVSRRSLDRLRARRSSRENSRDSLESVASPDWGAADQARPDELMEWLRWAVSQLPPKRAQVFALRCFAEMSYDQIASTLNIERGAVGVLLHEARRQLSNMLPIEWVEHRKLRCGHANT